MKAESVKAESVKAELSGKWHTTGGMAEPKAGIARVI